MKIIGITGHINSGKTTTANYIYDILGGEIRPFAYRMKRILAETFQLPLECFIDPKQKQLQTKWNKTPRQLMQAFGTNFIRNTIDPDFWVKTYEPAKTLTIIDDVRFPNEGKYCMENGILIYVFRPGIDYAYVDYHESECHIDRLREKATWIIMNDGTLEDLRRNVDDLCDSLKQCQN